MNRYGSRHKGVLPANRLTINDIFFCNEYMANGRNGTRAYMKVHPKANHNSARAEATRVLAKPAVREHMARLERAATPDTIESIRADLDLARSMAMAANDHDSIERIAMDRAKLAGLLVDKHADVTEKSPEIPQPQLVEAMKQRLARLSPENTQ